MDMGETAECPEDKSSLPKQELKGEMKRTRYYLCFWLQESEKAKILGVSRR